MGGQDGDGWQTSHRFEMRGRSPTLAVIQSVARVGDREPIDLPPLADYVDPEALDELIGSHSDVAVQFDYAGVEVEIDGSGAIVVREN